MNPKQFANRLQQKQAALRQYINNVFPRKAGEISLRFIDNNFRAQGWHGQTFQPWQPIRRKGTILVKTGTLRRGNYFTTSPGVTRVRNDVKYAAAHNNGFRGTVEVKAHRRILLSGKKVATGRITYKTGQKQTITIHGVKGIQQVKSHTRVMNIPKRQFFPHAYNDSPVLLNNLVNEMTAGMKNIFQ